MKKKNKGFVFKVIGIICLLLALGLSVYNLYEDHYAGEVSLEVAQELIEEITVNKETDWGLEIDPYMEMSTKLIDGNYYIGVLDIPALDLSLPIMEDWSYAKLRKSPCRYSGSLYLDNIVIAGHNYPKHFSHVKRLPAGTDIYFTDMDGRKFHYKIVSIETLKPNQVDDLIKDSEQWDLSLFTCTYTGRTRAVIRCVKQGIEL